MRLSRGKSRGRRLQVIGRGETCGEEIASTRQGFGSAGVVQGTVQAIRTGPCQLAVGLPRPAPTVGV